MTRLGNARHERSGHRMEDFEDPRQCRSEDRSDFGTSEIAGCKDEHSRFAGSERGDLQRSVSQPLILGEHHPAALADGSKPDAVLLIAREMVVVDLDCETNLDEFRSDWIYAKRPVDEKYGFIRRLRSGWLLRFHWCPD